MGMTISCRLPCVAIVTAHADSKDNDCIQAVNAAADTFEVVGY